MGRFCNLTRVIKPYKKILISGTSAMNQFSSTTKVLQRFRNHAELNLPKLIKLFLPYSQHLKFPVSLTTRKLCCHWISGFETYACRSMK